MMTLNQRSELAQEVCQLNLQIVPQGILNVLHIQPTLEDRIKQAQEKDEEIQQFKEKVVIRNFQDSEPTSKGSYGTKIGYAYQRMKHSKG
jgi:aminoglycoside phosphotransferase family enzyme